MYKALVIGCGNIGAEYDFESDDILTHAKALYLNSDFDLTIFDINPDQTEKIAKKYKCAVVNDINLVDFKIYDLVSICTPTATHHEYLAMLISAEVKLIICEKPVSNNINDLESLHAIYLKGKSKIIVNYIRRFQPAYFIVKNLVDKLLTTEKLTNISIRYQRGFINNCSHAIDISQFLLGNEISISNIKLHNGVTDHFKNDPTISLLGNWNDVNVSILGLANVKFSHFEIDLYFEQSKIAIKNAGQLIELYRSENKQIFLEPLFLDSKHIYTDCLKNYMKFVIDHAEQILSGKIVEDNFLASIDLNKKMLNYIKN